MIFLFQSEILLKTTQIKSIDIKKLKNYLYIKVQYILGKKINQYKKTDLKLEKFHKNPFFNINNNINIKLNAVVGDIAYINNHIVKKGQKLFGFELIDIKSNQVIMQKQGHKIILRIFDE
jgi:hypothetical protein